jgi:amino acid adenylation domain-containing protein
MSILSFFSPHTIPDPAAIAIKDATGSISYEQLGHRVDRLAHHLRQRGVKPEVLVGIYAHRSIDLAIAILAIIQAGGAYIPLDPSYPSARLTSIIDETNVRLILTQQQLASDSIIAGIDSFLLDAEWDEISMTTADSEARSITPDRLAYLMYTSGSTGKPQGVQITIGQIKSYLAAVNRVVNIQPHDIYLHTASFSFSSSVRQLLLPLSQGAKVVIASKENLTNLSSLLELIQSEQITIFDTVASVWNYLLMNLAQMESAAIGDKKDLKIRLAIFSGGLLTCKLLDRVRHSFPQPIDVVNIYGQTETIGVCAYPVPDRFDRLAGYIPVGKPYAHNQIYILDEQLKPVSVGEIGELCVAGSSLARGYFNNPQLNERKFIDNIAIDNDKPCRIYKTGDLARYLPDGNLEIVGRQDFQVKIRGMRVEIEGIETLLMEHPDVQQAAVVGKKDRFDEETIVAYIVGDRTTINIGNIRSWLEPKLIDAAIPSAFILLDALPLTANNKLDRRRLPEPNRENITIVHPRDRTELELTKIWERVLAVTSIGINDNFFELGGHSLSALQLFAEIEKIWNKRLLLSVLFESPTITKLAQIIRQTADLTNWSPLVAIEPGDRQPPLFCIHPIGGNLFDYYGLAKKLDRNRPIYGLQARGIDGKQPPLDRIEDMASYFIEEIRSVQPQGPYFLLGYSFGGIVAFEMAKQLAGRNQSVEFLGLLDIQSPTLPEIHSPLLHRVQFHFNNLKKLTMRGRISYVIDRLFFNKRTEYRDEVISTLSERKLFTPELLNVLDCNVRAKQNYHPQVYNGTATLFRSEDRFIYMDRHPEFGWKDLITGELGIEDIPGTHLTLMKSPNVGVLAKKLTSCIQVGRGELEIE